MKKVVAKAFANIALIKYWGKKDPERMIPFNSSLSMTLDGLYTITSIEESENGFAFFLDGVEASKKETDKVIRFLGQFSSSEQLKGIRVQSNNSFPIAAGLASSASGFAALAVAANEYFETRFNEEHLAQVTRMGSGSACRSLYSGFVAWEKEGPVYEVACPVQDWMMIVVILDSKQKKQSSRDAMAATVATSPLYSEWVSQANVDFIEMKRALLTGDEVAVGRLTEKSSSLMHQTMQEAIPPVDYQTSKSLEVLNLVKELRSQGVYAYATMDAGPNVKILTKVSHVPHIIKELQARGYSDTVVSGLGKKAGVLSVQR